MSEGHDMVAGGKPEKIAVLGAGAWGTALAAMLVRNHHEVLLWARDEGHADAMNASGFNLKYLGEIPLPQGVKVCADLEIAVAQASHVLMVTPAQSIAAMAQALEGKLRTDCELILCAKGIDRTSGKTPAQLVVDLAPEENISVLSGPSFAIDVMQAKPTAVTLASSNIEKAGQLATQLSGKNFRIYANDDVHGVELGGALKNVLALCVGVARGMELGASAEAALIARGFAELRRLSEVLGAKPDTLLGLSGLGDLVLTASSPQSRNFSYGIALGCGQDTSNLALAEGAFTASIAAQMARDNGVDVPIIASIGAVIEKRITAQDAVIALMARPLRSE